MGAKTFLPLNGQLFEGEIIMQSIPFTTARGRKLFKLALSEDDFHSLQNDYSGFCLLCGEIAFGDTEPDARGYQCDRCDRRGVYGIEELAFMGLLELTEIKENE